MSEKHRNIFYYYRGPNRTNDAESNEVLENNLTKALLNTIDRCPNLGIQFINWLNRRHGLHLDPPNITDLRILEGPTEEEIEQKKIKVMIGIKKYNGEDYPGIKGGDRRVDGVVVGENWLIAIESKLNGIDTRQFEEEKNRVHAEKQLVISWRDINDFLCGLDEKHCDPIDKLFKEQFTGFLAAVGQLPFRGFTQKHFDFFHRRKSRSERERERLELKNLINTLGADLWDYKDGNGILKDSYKGGWDWVKGLNKNSKLDWAELRFYASSRKNVENQCYLDIMFAEDNPDRLNVYAGAEARNVLAKFSNKLRQNKDRSRIHKLLNEKSLVQFSVDLWDVNDDALLGDLLLNPGKNEITKPNLLQLSDVIKENINNRDLGFGITRSFGKSEIIGLNGQKQMELIAETMWALHPFMQFVNE